MLSDRRKWLRVLAGSASLLFAAVLDSAHAEGHHYSIDNADYRVECGACHVAYPPALLDASDWRAIMLGLDRHFGTDASLGEAKRAEITAYLQSAAGDDHSAGSTLRITQTRWFRNEHAEVARATWKLPAVMSASNCEACHLQAGKGDYGERHLLVPR